NDNPEIIKQNELKMSYGGLMLGYKFFDNNLIHGNLNTLIGAGGISSSYFNNDYKNLRAGGLTNNIKSSAFFVVQQSVSVDVKLLNSFSIGAGRGYRYITGNTLAGLSNLKAPTLNLSLKFA